MKRKKIALALSLLFATAAPGQQMTPRELFYSAPAAAAPAPRRSRPAPKKNRTPAQEPAVAASRPAAPAPVRQPAPSPAPASAPETGSVPMVLASHTQQTPLGLRYSILKRTADGQHEVDPDTVFRAGDRIRLGVEVNDNGHLYIVNRGSSGNWQVLFPSQEVSGGDNRVSRGVRYEIPSGYTFTFDEQAGTEQLFIIVSRQPVADIDGLIYSLQTGKPAAAPAPERRQPMLLLASNMPSIEDRIIGQMRNAYARDLVIEKIDEKTQGDRPEKAVYVVNPSGGAESRVVADVKLIHR